MERLKFTILGCGASPGVPWITGHWGACDPQEPRNRRSRCAMLVERFSSNGVTRVLIDAGPDVRSQLIAAQADWLDGVVFTHSHADHVHGIDDLRGFVIVSRGLVDVYSDEPTQARLSQAFGYCFASPRGSEYPPILRRHAIASGRIFEVPGAGGGIAILPFTQFHGSIQSLGVRIAGVAYSSDVSALPPESVALLADLDVWIVDALRYREHPSHFNVDQALNWINHLRPRRAILTHMTVDLDYTRLQASLPHGVEPAHDGLTFEVAAGRPPTPWVVFVP